MTRYKLYGKGGFAHAPGPEDDHFELFHGEDVVLDANGWDRVAEKSLGLSLKISHDSMLETLCDGKIIFE